jgi:Aspartyl protease
MSPRLAPDFFRRERRLRDDWMFQRRGSSAALFLFALLAMFTSARAADRSENSPGTNAGLQSVTIPFEMRRGHVMVPTTLHATNRLSLLLDTGYGMTMLRPDHVAAAELKRNGRGVTIVGIAGEERAEVFEGPRFDFDGLFWTPRRVAAFPAENQPRSRRGDGVLGSGFFRRFVVEISSARKQITLHEPETFKYSGSGEILPLTFKSSTPTVEATVKLPQGTEVRASFEIDTGCDSALCLGNHFVTEHGLTAGGGADGGRVGVGGSTRTREGRLTQLRLGRLMIEKPTANFFLEGSPVDPPLAGHIGWELLKDFHVILDYSRRLMILQRLE